MIPLARPCVGGAELEAVRRVLDSGRLVAGEQILGFEAALAARCGRKHALVVSSGTAALDLALQALGIGPDDDVLCPNLTWPSPANVARARGARVIPVDVCAREWNALPEAFTRARTPRTRAAIAIDQFGFPARLPEIVAALPDIAVVEDAACALGASIGGRPCGSFGRVSCLSFHPRKIVTTGEGGACLTDDDELALRIGALRNHGQSSPGAFGVASGNYRLSEIAAAIGRAQLERLDAQVAGRRAAAERYKQRLPELTWQAETAGCVATYQTMGAALAPRTTAQVRDGLLARLAAGGVQAGVLSYAISRLVPHAQGARAARLAGGDFAISESLVDRGFALPLYEGLTDAEQDAVIAAVRRELAEVA